MQGFFDNCHGAALLDRLPLHPSRRLNHTGDDPHVAFDAHNPCLFDNRRVPVNQLVLGKGDVLEVAINQEEDERPHRAPCRHGPPSDANGPREHFSGQEVEHFLTPGICLPPFHRRSMRMIEKRTSASLSP